MIVTYFLIITIINKLKKINVKNKNKYNKRVNNLFVINIKLKKNRKMKKLFKLKELEYWNEKNKFDKRK